MRKILVLLLLSMLVSTTALASSQHWHGLYAEGYLTTGASWAYAKTDSIYGPENIVVSVTLEYEMNGQIHFESDSQSDYHNSVETDVIIPSSGTPIRATGFHQIEVSGLGKIFSGQTYYSY